MGEKMYKIRLAVKRPFNWKALLVLLAMVIVAVPIAIPFSLTMQESNMAEVEQQLTEYGSSIPVWLLIVLDVLVDSAIIAILGALGLLMASRIGLGMPFIEGWTNKQPIWHRLPKVLAIAIIAGLVAGLVMIAVDSWGFGPRMQTIIESDSVTLSEGIKPPAWQGFLVSISAGITEEAMFRLFILTLIAWLGHFISRREDGRPTLAVLWIANLVAAVVFGLAHLPATQTIGLPITPFMIIRAITLNGLIGLMFGWLYWRFGLGSAMAAHFSVDVLIQVLLSLVTHNAENPALANGYLFGGLLVMVAIAAALWWFGPAWEEPAVAAESTPASA
jgi:hypothetical protein